MIALSKMVTQTRITENITIGPMVKKMTVYAPAIALKAVPGQFVHIRVPGGTLLRRPISIADVDKNRGTLTLIYRIVGMGTTQLSFLGPDGLLDCMGSLGKGFVLKGDRPLLVGGGMGIAPLLYLARELCPRPIEILMGGRSSNEMYWSEMFQDVCKEIHITTDDGSIGTRGTTLDMLPRLIDKKEIDIIYTCGPRAMMEGVAKLAIEAGICCQISLEEHMACGVGACLSCTCAATDGTRRKICSDGPVFNAEEVFTFG